MGAWIETRLKLVSCCLSLVAPHMGAWIETSPVAQSAQYRASHPIWVRGLKRYGRLNYASTAKSHPIWVRGLKLRQRVNNLKFVKSHPIWVRGLKLNDKIPPYIARDVAPHMGAWIETFCRMQSCAPRASRTPYGCVD